MKQGQTKFYAKRNVGTKEEPKWEYYGTAIIRQGNTGGVLFVKTGKKGADGKDESLEIALFRPRKEKGGAEGAAAAAA